MKPILQSSLGTVKNVSTRINRVSSLGFLSFGKVLKVHHKRYTADVQLFSTNDVLKSSSKTEGRYACRISTENAGYDSILKKPYGKIVPIQKGAIVLVGFLENSREKPVILSVFHDISEEIGQENTKNILTSIYPIIDENEMLRYVNINRIQDFVTISGDGNIEVASHTKSFFVGINNKEIIEETFDFENLSIKDSTRKTINSGELNSKPMKWIAVFRSNFSDLVTNWLRLIVDASKSSFKLAQQDRTTNKLSTIEVTSEGTITISRQLDTERFSGSEDFSEVSILSSGDILLQKSGDISVKLEFTSKGLNISTNKEVNITAEEITLRTQNTSLVMSSDDIKIIGETVDIIERR